MKMYHSGSMPATEEPAYVRVLAATFLVGWCVAALTPSVISTVAAVICVAVVMYPILVYVVNKIIQVSGAVKRSRMQMREHIPVDVPAVDIS